MNKVIAEIIVGIIPNRPLKNRCRRILRYGLIRTLKLILSIKRNKIEPHIYLAICAIAKNEGPYFKEWIEWHHSKGVEKFYIYDNESSDNTKEVLEPYIQSGLVEYTFRAGKKQQLPVYSDCLDKHRFDTQWIAVIDIDEFIVPIHDKTIPEFLKKFEDFAAIEINWLVYGSAGAKEKEQGDVMERFKYHSVPKNTINRHVKSIVNPRRAFMFIGSHEAIRLSGYTVDTHGKRTKKNFFEREPIHDVIRINHYAVKSYQEFLGKRARGRSRTNDIRRLDYFDRFDLNDIKE
jgi:hypothetical protein